MSQPIQSGPGTSSIFLQAPSPSLLMQPPPPGGGPPPPTIGTDSVSTTGTPARLIDNGMIATPQSDQSTDSGDALTQMKAAIQNGQITADPHHDNLKKDLTLGLGVGAGAALVLGAPVAAVGLGVGAIVSATHRTLGDYAQASGKHVAHHEGDETKLNTAQQKLEQDQNAGASDQTIQKDQKDVTKYQNAVTKDGQKLYNDDYHIEGKVRKAAGKLHKADDTLTNDQAKLQADQNNHASSHQLKKDEKHIKKDQHHVDKDQKHLTKNISRAEARAGYDPVAQAHFRSVVAAGMQDAEDGSKTNEVYTKGGDKSGNADPLASGNADPQATGQ